MWILPALVGPAATLALEHAVGWRWALLAPVPIVLAGRAFRPRGRAGGRSRGRRARPGARGTRWSRPGGRPRAGRDRRPLVAAGGARRGRRAGRRRPAAAARDRPGRPAPPALAAMLLFGTGWFGADGLITVLLTDGYGTSVARAAVVLSAAPLAWAVTSLLARRVAFPAAAAAGLALAAGGVALLAGSSAYPVALVAWTLAGVGIGLAYPVLYLACTLSGGPMRGGAGHRGAHRGVVRRTARGGRRRGTGLARRRRRAAPGRRAGAHLRRLRRRADRRGARRPPGPAGGVTATVPTPAGDALVGLDRRAARRPRCWCSGTAPAARSSRRTWWRSAMPAWPPGISVARVTQPYRVAGREAPPAPPVLDSAWAAVLAALGRRKALAGLPLVYARPVLRRPGRLPHRRRPGVTPRPSRWSRSPFRCIHRQAGPESRLAELAAVPVPVLVVQGVSDPFGSRRRPATGPDRPPAAGRPLAQAAGRRPEAGRLRRRRLAGRRWASPLTAHSPSRRA